MMIIEIINKIEKLGYKLEGLDDNQINNIESYYDVTLPNDYKFFLKKMGKSGGGILRGEDCFYDRVFELREYANELLKDDNSSFEFKKEHFVFFSHQGYIFAFIDTTILNDSPIYYYFEGDLEPQIKYNYLACFLEEYIKKIQAID
ncbi:SMI1/KNR4 family protein [Flavobacterium terrae]|uniref:SMI1-KNR4 cell-wall n=1 Tax=Flavobacterium terrae TaxID=415425 RepID=A0A1M6AMQ9_9FLAO|nr:SMI1/KNR4 family protein [Flavobacterium terrae]SHI37608.1 SMI1-KNR4 cell-wall [Flavobacterium terrae]